MYDIVFGLGSASLNARVVVTIANRKSCTLTLYRAYFTPFLTLTLSLCVCVFLSWQIFHVELKVSVANYIWDSFVVYECILHILCANIFKLKQKFCDQDNWKRSKRERKKENEYRECERLGAINTKRMKLYTRTASLYWITLARIRYVLRVAWLLF